MSFLETVRRARSHLEAQGRVSLRALKREFELDDGALDELVEELVDAQQVAVRERQVLVWAGRVPSVPPIPVPSQVERAPRDYTPKHLADKILSQKSALEGERKQVTVLFADVKGSLDLQEDIDPEQWHRILDRFFQILADGVHRFDGTVNQYTGDGIMALFGAPLAHEDHAQRACYAALHLRDELRRYADELRRAESLNFSVRMGLNSGDVVVGKIGDDLRMDYTAQGHTVGLAARMEQLAEPGAVLLTEHTAKLASGYVELRSLGAFSLKGVREPVEVHALEGAGVMRTRFDVSRARGLSKFVGRTDEMAALEAALEHAGEGHGQVVGLVAEAGGGKSRLCHEFVERCRARGIVVRAGHAVSHGKMIPFLPVLEFIRSIFGIEERDDGQTARRKIAGTLVLLDRELDDALPLVFDFLGVPDPERPSPSLDLEERQRRLFGLIQRMLAVRRTSDPVLFVFEDLHWLDGASETFLEQLVDTIPATRTLLLVNFRPEFRVPWAQKSYYQQLPLLPLGPEAIDELLDHLLGGDPSVRALPDLIRERTGGNPFFVEEAVHSLVASGALEGARGAYCLVHPVEKLRVPATVQAILAARIDRLPEREKRLAQIAAVIGQRFQRSMLAQVADLPDDDLDAALAQLTDAELIFQGALYPQVEYAFKHPLTREVAYESQLHERRVSLHAAVAQTLEEVEPDKVDENAALLAHHWEAAGDAATAAHWHYRAGQGTTLRAPAEALRHYRRACALLEGVAETPESLALASDARIHSIWELMRVGAPTEEVAPVIEEAKALARRRGDVHSLVEMLITLGASRFAQGEMVEGLAATQEARELALETEDADIQLAALSISANPLSLTGRYRDALECCDGAIRVAEAAPGIVNILGFPWHVATHIWRSVVQLAQGHPDEAAASLERARSIGFESNPAMEVLYHYNHGLICEVRGDVDGALRHGREILRLAESYGVASSLAMGYASLGRAELMIGNWEGARAALEHALSVVREHRVFGFLEPNLLTCLAHVLRSVGELDAAEEAAREAVAVTERMGIRAFEAQAVVALAAALRARRGVEARGEIESLLDGAQALTDEIEQQAWKSGIHEERAALARLLGDDAAAERELRQAHRLFTEMGATSHAARVARELGS